MTNLNLYRIFCEVAKQKNITKASEVLFVSQPSVSSAIKELEISLGGQLFIRQNKGVVLTSYGQDIYNKIAPSIEKLKEIDHYFDDINTLQSGILRIGTNTSNTTQIMSKYLIKFASIYPNVKIKMIRDSQENLIKKLENQDIDIVYIDNEDIGDFNIVESYDIEYQLIGSIDYFEKFKNKPIDSLNFPVNEIILPNYVNTSRTLIEQFLKKHDIIIKPKYEVDNYSILYDMVKEGLGIAFVNADYYKDKIGSEVFLIPSTIKFLARKINAVYNKKSKNPTLEQFIDIMID
ncbi:MAG: LysR family transcriptional regulator [Clostridia bacterium]|nr:LysR family transcriptional regulator [Clostridia bacterium]